MVAVLKDTAGGGLPLKLDGTAYAKGLWVAPETTLTYKLGSDFREFKAIVGISESTEVASSGAKLVISADGRELFSGPITRKAKPKELVLEVKGVKELTRSASIRSDSSPGIRWFWPRLGCKSKKHSPRPASNH